MAIAFRAAASGQKTDPAATSVDLVIPAGVQAGDGMLLFFGGGDVDPITPPAGWTAVDTAAMPTGTTGRRSDCWVRVADTSDPGSTLTLPYSPDEQNAVLLLAAYSGVDPTTPVHVHAVRSETIETTTHASPTVDTTIDGCAIVHALIERSLSTSIATPTGDVKRVEHFIGGAAQYDGAIADDGTVHPAGTGLGGGSWSTDSAEVNVITWTVALTPQQTSQLLKPSTDIATAGFTASPPLAAGETYASRLADGVTGTYIESPVNPFDAVIENGLPAGIAPADRSGYVVSYTISSANGATTSSYTMALMQGATVIAQWTEVDVPDTPTQYSHTLTDAQCQAITDYAALSLRRTMSAS